MQEWHRCHWENKGNTTKQKTTTPNRHQKQIKFNPCDAPWEDTAFGIILVFLRQKMPWRASLLKV